MFEQLHRDYLKERQGQDLLEFPGGFVIYKIVKEKCFLRDIFVSKDHRKTGVGKRMLNELVNLARAQQCAEISAHIYTQDPNGNDTLRAAFACGFAVQACGENVLLITKNIGGL